MHRKLVAVSSGGTTYRHLCINVNAAEVLCESWSPDELSYRKDGVLLVGELLSEIHQSRTLRYLANRERVTTNGFPWTHSQIGPLQDVLKQASTFKTIEARGRSSKFTWDHIGHGRNQSKWDANGGTAEPCPLCGDSNDDMQHIAAECLNPAMQTRRNQCWDDCAHLIARRVPHAIVGHYLSTMLSTMKAGRTRGTHAIMLGRPLDYNIRAWGTLHGTCPVTLGASFRKYAANMLAITIMAVIGLWICRGTERQRTQQPGTSIQQVLFMDGEEGMDWDSSPEDQERGGIYTVKSQGGRRRMGSCPRPQRRVSDSPHGITKRTP